ncbi:MAG: bifunctional nuclease family protein, partial [Aquificota bacterium]
IENENHIYPIWIGVAEAEGIILGTSKIETPRPLTYDLIKNIIESLKATVEKVAVIDYKNGAYIAEIILKKENGEEIAIDSRPSDAINIALRFDAPIYLDENVVKKVDIKDIKEDKAETEEKENIQTTVEEMDKLTQPEKDEELEKFRKMLENIKPEDFAIKPEKNNKKEG